MFGIFKKNKPFSSAEYWENRYRKGGHSGAGSYEELAGFKAEILNNAFSEHGIKQVIEFGCGDGNQLSMLRVPTYIGLDVSESVLKICIRKFESDKSKSFFIYNSLTFADRQHLFQCEAAISLDVIFHLTETYVFEKYLSDLFSSALKLVIIYAADIDYNPKTKHELYRKFTGYVEDNFPVWELEKIIKNKYPSKNLTDQNGSLSDFYFFVKKQPPSAGIPAM